MTHDWTRLQEAPARTIMLEYLQPLWANPVLPASMLLGLMVGWSLLVSLFGIAAFGIDHGLPFGHFWNADSGLDAAVGSVGHHHSLTESVSGLGMLSLRWLNMHEMPVMIWMGIFSFLWWVVSLGLWLCVDTLFVSDTGWILTPLLIVRNLAIALPVTKICTHPFRGWFQSSHVTTTEIIGKECVISSSEATTTFGQVKLKTDAAPLLLNVRTDGPHLAKGTRVWITHYDSKRRVYLVSPISHEHNL